MNSQDRGLLKFQPFIMPEQRKLIHDFHIEEMKIPKPFLSEEQLEDINETLMISLHNKQEVLVKIYKNGFISDEVGIIRRVEPVYRKVMIQKPNLSNRVTYSIDEIIDIILL